MKKLKLQPLVKYPLNMNSPPAEILCQFGNHLAVRWDGLKEFGLVKFWNKTITLIVKGEDKWLLNFIPRSSNTWHFGSVTGSTHQPKASVFDDWGMRLNNQLSHTAMLK